MRRALLAGVVVALACGVAPSAASEGRRTSSADEGRRTLSDRSSSQGVEAAAEGEPTAPGPQAGGPRLKPGFPVDVHFSAGTWQCCASGVLVADVDGDPDLEILVSGVARGLVTAVDPDGTLLPGWPVGTGAHQFLSAGEVDPARPGLEVVANDWGSLLAAYDDRGRALPGWPRRIGNEGLHPAVAADLDDDGVDELLLDPADEKYWAVDSEGESPRGTSWPQLTSREEQRLTQPAVADLDGDGSPEVVGAEPVNMYRSVPNVYAWRADGTPVPGWPVRVEGIGHSDRVVVGDVLGDSAPEVVVEVGGGFEVLSPTGQALASWTARTSDDQYADASHPALGDLDDDGDFEVVVATPSAVHALQGDGTALPGWPRPVQSISPVPFDAAHPVIGDLDNDGHQDVVLTADTYGADWIEEQWVWAWDAGGDSLPGFPFWLPTLNDWAPAIADVDNNGRSDLVLAGRDPGYRGGWSPGVFVFEYPTGEAAPPDWGQLSGGARRQGVPRQGSYADPATPPAAGAPTPFALLRDASPGSSGSAPEDLVVLDDAHVVYTAATSGAGRELWISDGTPAGTRELADIRPGSASSAPDQLVARGGRVWFTADDGVHGREVWTTDGTPAGTRLVHDTEPGSYGSQPQELTLDATGRLFFTARTVRGRDLWVSDGAQTQLVVDLTPAEANGSHDDSQAKWLATAGNRVVWVSRVRPALGDSVDVNLVSTTGPGAPVVQLLPDVDLAENAGEPLFTGGATTGGTWAWIRVANRLVRTDGTLAGTVVQTWPDYDDPQQGAPVPRGAEALFAAHDDSVGRELRAFPDRLVADLDTEWRVPGGTGEHASGAPADLTLWHGGWFFTARTTTEGREPWWTDGAGDTRQLGDVVPGTGGSRPTPLVTLGDRLLLRATTPGTGAEPWILSAEGAVRVADVAGGTRGSDAGEAIRLGDRILVVLDDGTSGRELWAVDVADLPTPTSWPSTPTPTAPSTPVPTTAPSTPVPTTAPAPTSAPTPTTTSAPTPGSLVPDTRLGRHPEARTRSRRARFGFRSTLPDSSFQCRLDGRRWRTCASPVRYRKLAPGRHVFRVRAVRFAAGQSVVDPTPVRFRWRVRP